MFYFEPRHEKTCHWNLASGFETGPTQIRLWSHRRWFEFFWIMIEEGLYYLCSKNKEADQLQLLHS